MLIAFLLVLFIYTTGETDVIAFPRASVEACIEDLAVDRVRVQNLSDANPGQIRMFAMACAGSEYVETGKRS